MQSNVARFLRLQAAEQPDGAAVRAPVGRPGRPGAPIRYAERTFAELERESNAVCRVLEERGVARGERVLLMVKPGLDLIRVVFALFKMGAIPVTIDPGMGLRGLLRCVRHSRPEHLVGIPAAVWVSRLAWGSFASLQSRIAVDRTFQRQVAGFVAAGADYEPFAAAPEDPAAILFTSGSTGPAKGVCYAHGMFAAQVESILRNFGIEPGETDLPMLPVFALFNPALGMTTVVPQMNPSRPATVDPARIVQAIRQNGVTNSFGSPALWTRIGRYCRENAITLPTIRRLLVAGAPVSAELMKLLAEVCPNGTIHSPYGATEALPVTSIDNATVLRLAAGALRPDAGTCVGRPLAGIDLRVIEAVDGEIAEAAAMRPVGSGTIGEIVVHGPVVTREYDQLPEATRNSKIAASECTVWHRMGDMGYLDAEGRLWFCGRKAERVFCRGGTVLYTDPCEQVFNRCPGVFRSALIGVGPERDLPAVVVEPEAGAWPKGRAARAAFAAKLREAAVAHPHTAGIERFYFCRRFPVDVRHNAKIHRLTLARRFQFAS